MIRAALLYHVYSGHLFFTAAAMLVIGLFVPRLRVLVLLGLGLGALSGTPMALWLAIPLAVTAVAAMVKPDRKPLAIAAAVLSLLAVGFELPYHIRRAGAAPATRLFVIGDSLASGGFGEKTTWPAILGATNLARPSDTAATAREQAAMLPPPAPGDCVIVEIGGNDMLEGSKDFPIDALLRDIQPRTIVMLELPVIPGRWRYGAAQRRAARRYEAILVPKRVLASVLLRHTTDGLHLTERGHAQLARDLVPYVTQ